MVFLLILSYILYSVLFLILTIVLLIIGLKTSKRLENYWVSFLCEVILKPKTGVVFEPYRARLLKDLKLVTSKNIKHLKEEKLRILEIGAGGGRNFKYYPEKTSLICVDPNQSFHKYFEKNKRMFPNIEVELFVNSGAEDMSVVQDESVDVVVSTHVLCSVDNVEKVLQEIKRVLIKGGQFYYAEHGGCRDNSNIFSLQKMIEPVWMILAGNCRLTRDIGESVKNTGFGKVNQYYEIVEKFPLFAKYHVFGIATK